MSAIKPLIQPHLPIWQTMNAMVRGDDRNAMKFIFSSCPEQINRGFDGVGMDKIWLELPQELMQFTDGLAVPTASDGDSVIFQTQSPHIIVKGIRLAQSANPVL